MKWETVKQKVAQEIRSDFLTSSDWRMLAALEKENNNGKKT